MCNVECNCVSETSICCTNLGVRSKHTGAVWATRVDEREREIRRVALAVEERYGSPRLGNPKDPLSDLVYIIISNRTSPLAARRAYQALRRQFPYWEQVLASGGTRKVRDILAPVGLSRLRSSQIVRSLRIVRRDFGRCTLSPLRRMTSDDALSYLVRLPGASDKVARCVAMYTLGAGVLPVDTHVFRVATRLGWTRRGRPAQCHEELEALVPPALRFSVHTNFVALGRDICPPKNPDCDNCPIVSACRWGTRR